MLNSNNNPKAELLNKLEALMNTGLHKQTLMLTNETRDAPYKDFDVKNVYKSFKSFQGTPNTATQGEFLDALDKCKLRKRSGFNFEAIKEVAQTIVPPEVSRPGTPKLD